MIAGREREAYQVAEGECVRCAGCATVAPGLFGVGPTAARVVRAPATDDERHRARAALLLCPTSAIALRPPADGAVDPAAGRDPAPAAAGPLDDLIGHRGLLEAEAVRWRMGDLPLGELDAARADGPLRHLAREVALSESSTLSASGRFLHEFADDADLGQWIAVWLYEESRHPQAMIAWLGALGERIPPRELARARVTAPFIRSRTGTLVMNVVSEVIAAQRYLALARACPEPVLGRIAGWLGADEARHGATFFAFARRRLERSTEPEVDRLDALKVLYFWLFEQSELRHPVNLFADKARTDPELAGPMKLMTEDAARVSRRVCQVVAHLVDLPLAGPESVMPALRAQAERVRAATVRQRGSSPASRPPT